MQITEINVVPKDFILEKPFKFASYNLEYLPYALVQVKTDEGITGYGECPAYWDPSGETQESAIGAIKLISPNLVGEDPSNISFAMERFDSLAYGAFSAKCGLDMALLDIIGKEQKVPVYKLLGGGSYEVKINAVIPMTSPEAAGSMAKNFYSQGFEYYKVKVGIDLEKELQVLDKVYEEVKGNGKIFVDANQGWKNAKNALKALRKMEKYELVWAEQPVIAYDLNGLKMLHESIDIPIMADESLYSPVDAFRLAAGNYVDMFNIKLAKSGGMWLGSKIKTIADAANIECALGSMIESSLGMLADYHFARSHKMKVCGLSASGYIKDNYEFGIAMNKDRMLLRKELPGLGYDKEEVLEKEFDKVLRK
ncbi:MAG: dipeptide epimerase [Candidatus Marsarchaeota archaeon]|jgi:L-alanine-DL-glutamate epimerase-like enolase superfamily enzyme|nr:dipeptide epimerase [Candidatus Marsarchaeota archaeon]MCL5418593.1 dipeptide epimerase [Candidatus Marsarchaeota archaeon]